MTHCCTVRWPHSGRRFTRRTCLTCLCFVFFLSNGQLDPWSAGGVTKNISENLVAVLIADGAHHLDLRHKNDDDPASVVEARRLEKRYIAQWIDQYQDALRENKAAEHEKRH